MPSVTMDRQMFTIQMRKYSPAWPVNLRETKSLAADCAASDGCATSPPGFLSSTARMETIRSIDVRPRGLKESGNWVLFEKRRPGRGHAGLERQGSNPISAQ